jgi:hypothetical protein
MRETRPADTASLIQAYAYDLLPDGCRGMVDIRVAGAREPAKWEVPTKDLPEKFATEFADLYKLTVSSAKVRQRTAEWVQLMREANPRPKNKKPGARRQITFSGRRSLRRTA